MPEDARFLRARLEMEYSRFHNFCEVSGLAEQEERDVLPEMLRPHKLVLFAILAEIEHCMNQLANINGEFEELQPTTHATDIGTNDALAQGFSQLSISYEKTSPEKKHWKGFNHVARAFDMTGNVVKKPKRLKWAAFKKDVFIEFLGRLVTLNTYLEAMVQGHKGKVIEDTLQNMYLEMVQVRTSQQELLQLFKAAQLFSQAPDQNAIQSPPTVILDEVNRSTRSIPEVTAELSRALSSDRMLASLVHSKSLRVATDAQENQRPQILDDATQHTEIAFTQIRYNHSSTLKKAQGVRVRTQATYQSSEASEINVWIEWRSYRLDHDNEVPLPKNLDRVKQLVALLQSAKQNEFCTPKCLGWFDNRDHGKQSSNPSQFGLVFQKPRHGKKPISLSEMINTRSKPSLTDRMVLAHLIARCLLYLHAVNWLHKGLSSDSIVFVPTEDTVDVTRPCVTGYDYARPDKDGETSLSTSGEEDIEAQIYVHPSYQGRLAIGNYRKTFDVYSLGIVLLEIVRWKQVRDIMELGVKLSEEEVKKVRSRLLEPENKHMLQLKEDFGDKLGGAVQSCLVGREAFGIAESEKEMEPATGAKLQRAFIEQVVEALRDIQI